MGGLFSSQEERPKPRSSSYTSQIYAERPTSPTTYNYSSTRPTQESRSSFQPISRQSYYNDYETTLARNFRGLTLEAGGTARRQIQTAERSTLNPAILDIQWDPHYNYASVVTYIELLPYETEYTTITRMITNKKNFKVDSIERIENPYLKKAYALKKEEKRLKFGNVEERLLFHGTKRANVDAICKMNFDWRLCQAHKFGKGVSFSPNSTYASNYSDEKVYNKIMLVAKVLIAKTCTGDAAMQLPDFGYDTSEKPGGVVLVKYEDNEFWPLYKINYHVLDENVGKRPKNYRRRAGRVHNNFSFSSYEDY